MMNQKWIEAKIHDIRSQIALLEAQAGDEVQGAVGASIDRASIVEFQERRIRTLETLMEMSIEEARKKALELLRAWVAAPKLETRVDLALTLYALRSNLEEFMAQVEAEHAS